MTPEILNKIEKKEAEDKRQAAQQQEEEQFFNRVLKAGVCPVYGEKLQKTNPIKRGFLWIKYTDYLRDFYKCEQCSFSYEKYIL